MSQSRLKTAVLGLNTKGMLLLEAASKSDHFQILAVADKDTKLAETTARQYDCSAFDDYRQLIIQNQLDSLLVAADIYNCDEHVRAAMKKKFNILKFAPPARNFEETVDLVRLAKDEKVTFALANPCRFAESFLALRTFLQQDQIEQVFLLTAICNGSSKTHSTWQSDRKLAGGGVLLRDSYELIDQIIWNFEMPQQIYSLNTNYARDRKQRLYMTEDTALATMTFSDFFFANLITSRHAVAEPEQKLLKIYGKDKILTVSDTRFAVSDAAGQIIEESLYNDSELDRMSRVLENFALHIFCPDENKLCSSARDNLKNMAVIESAYLSALTAMPEEPNKILQIESQQSGTSTHI